jgi:hypothetical protein
VAANGVELPQEALLRVDVVTLGEQPVHQSGDEIGTERQPCGNVPLALVLRLGALQKGSVRQDIRRRLGFTEELLRREQGASFREQG